MTFIFDEKARKEYELKYHNEIKYSGQNINDIIIKPVDAKFARPYIATHHYSQNLPDSSRFIYAGFVDDILFGIVVFGMGANKKQYAYLIPDIQDGEYVELTRMWSPDGFPKNTESVLISKAIKQLPDKIRLIVSYADSSKNHIGYIYQATNWYYLGKTNASKMLIDKKGIIRHPKSINIVRLRHPEYKNKTSQEIMDAYEWKHIKGGIKHRYCYLRGNKKQKKQMFKIIKNKILPYPKDSKIGFFQKELKETQKQIDLFSLL
jgi:hypothetical protein